MDVSAAVVADARPLLHRAAEQPSQARPAPAAGAGLVRLDASKSFTLSVTIGRETMHD